MKNIFNSFLVLIILLTAICSLAGCKAEIKYVDKVIEKTYVSPVIFTTVDAGEKGVTITMVTETEGAVIYYTEDGSTPTASSTVYSGSVTYSTEKTVKAIAVKTGMENSPVSSVSVNVKTKIVTDTVTKYICPKCEKEYSTAEAAANCCGVQYQDKTYVSPVVFTATDSGDSGIIITMSTATEGAVIYYTEDGSTPTASSTVYSSTVTYSTDKTVKAIAVKTGMENSPVSSVSVTIKTKTVTNTVYINAVPAGTYNVYHFQQKIGGGKAFSDYTLTDTDSLKTIAADSTIETLKKTYAGFTAKAMAQNETAIYIFYDRNPITYPDYSTCVVGDFILKDGSILSKDETPESGTVAAVIVRAKDGDTPALGVGIVHNKSRLAWCVSSATGYSLNITGLQGTTTSGYMDGGDGWEKLKAACSDAEEHPEYYPAWNYCLTYGTTNSLIGDLAEGWYLPTVAELKTIYNNNYHGNLIESSLKAACGNTFGSNFYLSCNQSSSSNNYAGSLYFNDGVYCYYTKNSVSYVCSVRAFN